MNKKKQLRALLKRLQDLQARADEAGVDAEEIQDELAEVEAAIAALEDAVDTVEETADEAAAAEGEEARADEDEDEDKKDETEERKSIAKARRSIREKLQRRAIAEGAGQARSLAGMASAKPAVPGADSKEYRSAFFKNLMGRDLTARERAAFVHTTANTSAVLPTETLNEIWDLVTGQHAIMGDIRILHSATTIEVIRHTAITQGNAASVNENAANDDETNTFVKVTLAGKDFSKHVDVSYALERMSVEAFESYIVNEIAGLLGEAMASDVYTTLTTTSGSPNTGMSSANAALVTAGVKKIEFAELAAALGALKRAGKVCIYGTRKTIYTYLVGMCDTTGRPIFQPSAQAGVEGVVLGCDIKVEDAVAENKLLIGDGSKFLYNMIQDVMIEQDRDIKKHVTTYAGYARGQGALIDETAFCLLTVKQSE